MTVKEYRLIDKPVEDIVALEDFHMHRQLCSNSNAAVVKDFVRSNMWLNTRQKTLSVITFRKDAISVLSYPVWKALHN